MAVAAWRHQKGTDNNQLKKATTTATATATAAAKATVTAGGGGGGGVVVSAGDDDGGNDDMDDELAGPGGWDADGGKGMIWVKYDFQFLCLWTRLGTLE